MPSKWKALREKLGLFTKRGSSAGCCGALWGSNEHSLSPQIEMIGEIAAAAGKTNLAAALAEERRMRAAEMERNSLMNRLEEEEEEEEEEKKRGVMGLGENCCVCMEKKKGAAFIPCGHAFCRGCARDLWIERRCCALCNRPILEILEIF